MARVTLEDIARMAGVSKATVSRVLNDKNDGYSEETAERVKKIVKDCGYLQASILTGAPYSARTRTIGLILPDTANPFFQQIIDVVEEFTYQQSYVLLLGGTHRSAQKEKRYIDAFVTKRVDGIILVATASDNQDSYRLLEKYKIPCVLLDRKYFGSGLFKAGVFIDSAYPVFRACEYLIQHGNARIVFLSGERGLSTATERFNGYCVALQQYSIELHPELIVYGDYTIQSGYSCITRLLKEQVVFDAIVASNDSMAIGALSAVKEAGLRVPEDIEIIGFDGTEIGEHVTPPLSTIVQPVREMGRKSVELLFELMAGRTIEKPFIQMEAKLTLRGTTR